MKVRIGRLVFTRRPINRLNSMNKVIFEDMGLLYADLGSLNNKLRNKSVLVTGGYGMVASYILWYLIYLNEYHFFNLKIYVLCRHKHKLIQKFGLDVCDANFEVILQDVCVDLMGRPRFDFIIHSASIASSEHFSTKPVDVINANVLGTFNILNKALLDESEGVLYISSMAVHGLVEGRVTVTEKDMGYMDPLDLRSCYGESKRLAETACISYFHQYGVKANIARLCHTYGPTMDLSDKRVFASFVADCIAGRDIKVLSDGSASRVFIYLRNAIDACLRILLSEPSGEAYNVTNHNNTVSIKDLAEMLAKISGSKSKVFFEPRKEGDTYLEANSPDIHPIFSGDKLKRDLGWICNVSVYDGFKRTIRSFEE